MQHPLKRVGALAPGQTPPPTLHLLPPPITHYNLTPLPHILWSTVAIHNAHLLLLLHTFTASPPKSNQSRNLNSCVSVNKKVGPENKDQKDVRDACSLLNQHGSCFIIRVETHSLMWLTSSLTFPTHTHTRRCLHSYTLAPQLHFKPL